MKAINTILTLFILLFAFHASAQITRRVSNRPGVDADFGTIQAGINGSSAGDTLYIEGSPFSYGNATFSKRLVVIGPGYFLDDNSQTQAYKESAKVEKMTFHSASSGSKVTGLQISYSSYHHSHAPIVIYANDITIRRNYIQANANYSGSSVSEAYKYPCIYISGIRSGIKIDQNFLEFEKIGTGSGGRARGIKVSKKNTNLTIRNNIFKGIGSKADYAISFESNANDSNNSIDIYNNIFNKSTHTYYTTFFNNIQISGNIYGSNNDYYNCIGDGMQFPIANNNQQNVDMATVFIDPSSSVDNGYLLLSGSSAIDAGLFGGDCGVFSEDGAGGLNNQTYKLSGIPYIPNIYEATIDNSGSTTLNANIKSKSNIENINF